MPLPTLDIETTTNTDGVWIRLRGETDITTHEQLLAGLAAVHLDGTRVVHVDLSGLAFCDVRSLCHILVFTSGAQRNGDNIVIHGASDQVLRMTNLLGVQDQPTFAALQNRAAGGAGRGNRVLPVAAPGESAESRVSADGQRRDATTPAGITTTKRLTRF
jgi:anti-anti-sigma factor